MTGIPQGNDMTYDAYVFDAYGTLFDVHAAARHLADEIGPRAAEMSEIWRNKQLEYTWIRGTIDRHQPFDKVTADGLDYAIECIGGVPDSVRQKLLDLYMELDDYAECKDVLRALKKAGKKTAILSNGTPAMLEAAVTSSGLGEFLDEVYSIESVGVYKPNTAVYQLPVQGLKVSAEQISFQSSNRWDAASGTAFGYRSVWVNRAGKPAEYNDLAPDLTLSDLNGLKDEL